jgi:hypothetical protein
VTPEAREVATCQRDDIHVHGPFTVPIWNGWAVFVGRMPIGAFVRKEWAERVAELLEHHGLDAVPDTPEELG